MTSHFCNLFCKRCGASLYAEARTRDYLLLGKSVTVTLECSECLLRMGGHDALNELQGAFLDADDHRMLEEIQTFSRRSQ